MAPKVVLEKQDKPGSIPEYLTVEQVATILQVSTSTITRQFGSLEGVIDLDTPERLHKRRRRILRIPRQTLERFIVERQVRRR
jgi:AcrR family transcriptional regulator